MEHKFWKQGLEKLIGGYNEQQFDENFVKFVCNLDPKCVSLEQKEVIESDLLKYNIASSEAQKQLQRLLDLIGRRSHEENNQAEAKPHRRKVSFTSLPRFSRLM